MILNWNDSDPVFYATSVLFILDNQKVTVVHVYTVAFSPKSKVIY